MLFFPLVMCGDSDVFSMPKKEWLTDEFAEYKYHVSLAINKITFIRAAVLDKVTRILFQNMDLKTNKEIIENHKLSEDIILKFLSMKFEYFDDFRFNDTSIDKFMVKCFPFTKFKPGEVYDFMESYFYYKDGEPRILNSNTEEYKDEMFKLTFVYNNNVYKECVKKLSEYFLKLEEKFIGYNLENKTDERNKAGDALNDFYKKLVRFELALRDLLKCDKFMKMPENMEEIKTIIAKKRELYE